MEFNRAKDVEIGVEHHAVLFALIARAAKVENGVRAANCIKESVKRYGRERGHRMMLRAVQDQRPLTIVTYLAYGEWRLNPEQMESRVTACCPIYCTEVMRCAWCEAWKQYDLKEFGAYYCKDVDRSLINGFNPSLSINIGKPITQGADCCRFQWNGFDASEENLSAFEKMKAEIGDRYVRDFLYHTAHLYTTMKQTITEYLPEHAGSIFERAERNFSGLFGENAILKIKDCQNIDFTK